MNIDFDLGFATLTSLTGYKDHDYSYVEDCDGLPTATFNYGRGMSRKLSSPGKGAIDCPSIAQLYSSYVDKL